MSPRLRSGLSVLLCGALWLGAAGAAAAEVLEYQVKAAFLYNFAKFVNWPPAKAPLAAGPIVFCLFERDPLADTLEQSLQGKTIDTHALAVRRLTRVEDMRSCHVAYLGTMDGGRVAAALDALSGSGVLTVYEGDETRRAGLVRFFLEDHRVRFEINTAATEREHLEVSSRLLGVARIAHE